MTTARVAGRAATDGVAGIPASAEAPSRSWPKRLVLAPIRFYRIAISPLRPPACRFVPSCSEYAVEAVERFGPLRGLGLALRRVLRCHPWHAGGHDPVPPYVGPHSEYPGTARRESTPRSS